ncbi:MAG: hypothetical protein ACI944_000697 [Natronomonas sp.]
MASVDDASRGTEARVVYRGPTRPTGTDLDFVRTDTERFEATFTPEAVGYGSVLDAEYAVNYAEEYGAVGQASAVEAAIDRTGGRAFRSSEAAAIAEFTRSEATRERAIQRSFGWVLLALALLVYLGEVAARRLGEIYSLGDVIS